MMTSARYISIFLMLLLPGMLLAQSPFLNTDWEGEKSCTLKEARAAVGVVRFLTLIRPQEARSFVRNFDKDFERFKDLETIVLMPGTVEALPEELARLTKLRVCIIAHHESIDYDQSLKVLAKVPWLYKVSFRGLPNVPPAIGLLTQIKQLEFIGGNFRSLPGEMANLNIFSLNLSSCKNLSDGALYMLKDLPNLRALNLSDCTFNELPLSALNIPLLTYLDLSNNRIEILRCPGSKKQLPLQELWIGYNPVREVDKDFFQCFKSPPFIRLRPVGTLDFDTQEAFIKKLSQDFGTDKIF